MNPERYPGRSAITTEMLTAWKDRNRWQRLRTQSATLYERLSAANRADAQRQQLAALRRVWVVLRAIR
jgi:hypothetical protein